MGVYTLSGFIHVFSCDSTSFTSAIVLTTSLMAASIAGLRRSVCSAASSSASFSVRSARTPRSCAARHLYDLVAWLLKYEWMRLTVAGMSVIDIVEVTGGKRHSSRRGELKAVLAGESSSRRER